MAGQITAVSYQRSAVNRWLAKWPVFAILILRKEKNLVAREPTVTQNNETLSYVQGDSGWQGRQ